jgi:O-glycosyl hydrolase
VGLSLLNYASASSAQVWQLDGGNAIRRLSDVSVSSGRLSVSVPAQSITLLVVGAGNGRPAKKPRRG